MSATKLEIADPRTSKCSAAGAAEAEHDSHAAKPSISWPARPPHVRPAARELLAPPPRAASRGSTPANCPTFLPETADIRQARLARWPRVPADLADRRVEITGPVDRKMVINALNSGAGCYMADFEDSHSPTWHGTLEGQVNLRDAVAGTIDFTSSRRQALSARRARRPRCWSARAAGTWKKPRAGRRPADFGQLFDFGLFFFHNAEACWTRGRARTSTCRSWKAIWKRGCGTTCSSGPRRAGHAAGHDQGHGADRDDPGRLRDGRDPLRAARPLGRAELRPLGLHLQLHQEVPQPARVRAARPGPGHDDHALPALVLAAVDQDLPSPRRTRHGGHGRADSDQERSGGQRAAHWTRSGPTRSARPATATTAPGWPIRAWCHVAMDVFDAHMLGPNQIGRIDTRTAGDGAHDLLQVPEGPITRGAADERRRGPALSGVLAARPRLRADLQPDGRRRHGRDLAGPDLAMDSPSAGRFADGTKITALLVEAGARRRAGKSAQERWAPTPTRPAASTRRANCFFRSAPSHGIRRVPDAVPSITSILDVIATAEDGRWSDHLRSFSGTIFLHSSSFLVHSRRKVTTHEPPTHCRRTESELDRSSRAGRESAATTRPTTWFACAGSLHVEHTLARRGAERLWQLA